MSSETTCRTCLMKTEKHTSLEKNIEIDGTLFNMCEILIICTGLKVELILRLCHCYVP